MTAQDHYFNSFYIPPPFKADIEDRYSDREWARAVVKQWKNDPFSMRPVSRQRCTTWAQQVYSRY
jgi:hypothetical protein